MMQNDLLFHCQPYIPTGIYGHICILPYMYFAQILENFGVVLVIYDSPNEVDYLAAESRGGDPPEHRWLSAEPFSELSNPIIFS